jgi:hypothetical protein
MRKTKLRRATWLVVIIIALLAVIPALLRTR